MARALTRDELLAEARKKLEALFREVDFIQRVEVRREIRDQSGPDWVVELFGREKNHVLLVETRISGEPRLAREAVNSLLLQMRHWSDACPVFLAPYISETTARLCRENRVGFLDLGGNCHLAFDNLFIHSRGHENPYKATRRLKTLSRPKTSRIVRVLLNEPHRRWQTQELARQTGVSLGLVANVKKFLKDKEWIDTAQKKITLARPDALLEEWIHSAGPAELLYYHNDAMDFIEIENAIAAYCRKNQRHCGFTGISGALHLASGIDTYGQVQACISGKAAIALEEQGFKPAEARQANVAIIQAPDPGIFHGMRRVLPASRLQYCRPSEKTVKTIETQIQAPIHILSPVQIYFDLRTTFNEPEEPAEKIFKQVIEPSW